MVNFTAVSRCIAVKENPDLSVRMSEIALYSGKTVMPLMRVELLPVFRCRYSIAWLQSAKTTISNKKSRQRGIYA